MPVDRLNLWYLPPAFFFCRRAMGEAFTRHFPRPLDGFRRAMSIAQSGHHAPRERGSVSEVSAWVEVIRDSLRRYSGAARSVKPERQ